MRFVMNLAQGLLGWLRKQSPLNAANPNPGTSPYNPGDYNTPPGGAQPIEISNEEEVTLGLNMRLGQQDSVVRGPTDELLRSRKDVYALCGCGHIAYQVQAKNKPGQQPVRGIAGKCAYCEGDFQEPLAKGLITLLEAERQSLVCSECARLTTSGVLSCPKHCVAMTEDNGQTVYLGPEEQTQLDRKQTTQKILTPFIWLFSDQNQKQITDQDRKNG